MDFSSKTYFKGGSNKSTPTRKGGAPETGSPASLRGISSALGRVHGADQKGFGGAEGKRGDDGMSQDKFEKKTPDTDQFLKNSGQFNDRATNGIGGNESKDMGPKPPQVANDSQGGNGRTSVSFDAGYNSHNTSDNAPFNPGEHTGMAEKKEGSKRSNFGPTRRFSNRIV